jgi:hypothetical protein
MGRVGHFTIMSTLLGNYLGHEEIVGSAFYSGYLVHEAIADLHYNYFMIGNARDECCIPKNTGRSMYDEWGVSELTTWPEDSSPTKSKGSSYLLLNSE